MWLLPECRDHSMMGFWIIRIYLEGKPARRQKLMSAMRRGCFVWEEA